MQSDSAYKDVVDAANMAAYARTETVDWYKDFEFILKPEAVILEAIGPAIKDRKILDIGIGGGRTTKFLLEVSSDYTGIDYTADFITAARERFPKANLLCCDARNLHGFDNATFDFVLFSFNAIDYMVHEDRLSCLAEINRVLKPGGWFMFSTHNRDYRHFDKYPWQERRFDLNHLKSCLHTFVHLLKHQRMKKYEVRTNEYAIINDNAHGFSLLAYYISFAAQVRQLTESGFISVEGYDMDGRPTQGDVHYPWIYYLARRAG